MGKQSSGFKHPYHGIRLVGMDADFIYWTCPSFSNAEEVYDVNISQRNGDMHCTCMDATCRKKHPCLVKGVDFHSCKHQRLVELLMRNNNFLKENENED